jgi:hypothetical protein
MYLNKSTIFRLEKDSTPKSIKWLSKQFQKTKELSEYVSRGGGGGKSLYTSITSSIKSPKERKHERWHSLPKL